MQNLSSKVMKAGCAGILIIASSFSIAGQSNNEGINIDGIAAQMKAEWKKEQSGCDPASRSKISNVTVISGTAQIKSRGKTFVTGGKEVKVLPAAHYLKASYPSAKSADPTYGTYGPVSNSAKSADFKNLIGMPICDNSTGD